MNTRDVDVLEAEAIDEAFKDQVGSAFHVFVENTIAGVPDAVEKFAKGRELLRQVRRLAHEQFNSPAS